MYNFNGLNAAFPRVYLGAACSTSQPLGVDLTLLSRSHPSNMNFFDSSRAYGMCVTLPRCLHVSQKLGMQCLLRVSRMNESGPFLYDTTATLKTPCSSVLTGPISIIDIRSQSKPINTIFQKPLWGMPVIVRYGDWWGAGFLIGQSTYLNFSSCFPLASSGQEQDLVYFRHIPGLFVTVRSQLISDR